MNQEKSFIVKGDMAFSNEDKELVTSPDSYLIIEEGIVKGVYEDIPVEYKNFSVKDHTGKLIIPGMVDLHLHAPQYTFRGLGMDMELLDWLNTYTFPEEEKYEDIAYAKEAYEVFVKDLKNSLTTRACVFATVHREATKELMNQLEDSGLITYVGKVNMDRNGSDKLCSLVAKEDYQETVQWIESVKDLKRTFPILTPRFIPSCTDELMSMLGEIQKETGLRVQSHLSENLSEIEWVKELVPSAITYGHAYELSGMLGSSNVPAVMAHCVYSSEEEIELLQEKGTYIAHCPDSNLNLASGIAPVRKYLDLNMNVGLGTDVAGGATISMARAITLAVQASKMYWRLIDNTKSFLKFEEAFYLATLGGGKYFGKTGSFLSGYEADILIIDDSGIIDFKKLSLAERLERIMYDEKEIKICDKYVFGKSLL